MAATLTSPGPGNGIPTIGTRSPDGAGSIRSWPPERVEAHDRAAETQRLRDARERRERQKAKLLGGLETDAGRRYRDCSFHNFDVRLPGQAAVIEAVRQYAAGLPPERARTGAGLLLFGPAGTGKDHLAIGVGREAIEQHGLAVRLVSGPALFRASRDAMSAGREGAVLRPYLACPLLILSDPVPPRGGLTDWQSGVLYELVDGRYRDRRPTITTVNVATGEEADQRLTPQILDRLRDGARILKCDWPSFRRAKP